MILEVMGRHARAGSRYTRGACGKRRYYLDSQIPFFVSQWCKICSGEKKRLAFYKHRRCRKAQRSGIYKRRAIIRPLGWSGVSVTWTQIEEIDRQRIALRRLGHLQRGDVNAASTGCGERTSARALRALASRRPTKWSLCKPERSFTVPLSDTIANIKNVSSDGQLVARRTTSISLPRRRKRNYIATRDTWTAATRRKKTRQTNLCVPASRANKKYEAVRKKNGGISGA